MESTASSPVRKKLLRLGMAFAVGLLATAGAAALSTSAAAQEKAVTYLGTLSHVGKGVGSCPLISQDIRVDVRDTKVTGYFTSSGSTGRFTFRGELEGSSFAIIRTAKTTGNKTRLSGNIEGDRLEVRIVGPGCSYRSVLKKTAAVRYVGTWKAPDQEGCGMTGRSMEVDIIGADVTGSREQVEGSSNVQLRGKLQGSSFTIERRMKNGNHETIPGEIKGDLVEVSYQGAKCSYRATLKKEEPKDPRA